MRPSTRKVAYVGYCMVVMLGLNCITDYGIITDNNQVSGAKAGKAAGVQPVINTRGKAHIIEFFQWVTLWPDGSDNLMSFVDQKADGTATLYTYNNFSTGSEPLFHDDLYCNTDREGCSVFTAPDNNDFNYYDGDFNTNCSGARSLLFLLASSRFYGECGRLGKRGNKLSLENKLALFNSATFANRLGREGLLYGLDASNLRINLTTGTGQTFAVPIRGAMQAWVSGQDNVAQLDLRNTLVSSSLTWYAEFLETQATEVTEATVTYQGISLPFTIAGKHPVIDRNHILARRNQAY